MRHTLRAGTVVRIVEAAATLDGHAEQAAAGSQRSSSPARAPDRRRPDSVMFSGTKRGHARERVGALAPGVVVVIA